MKEMFQAEKSLEHFKAILEARGVTNLLHMLYQYFVLINTHLVLHELIYKFKWTLLNVNELI